jgi:hypothetical protein
MGCGHVSSMSVDEVGEACRGVIHGRAEGGLEGEVDSEVSPYTLRVFFKGPTLVKVILQSALILL